MLADMGRGDFVLPVRLWLSSTPCKAPCEAHRNILYFRIASRKYLKCRNLSISIN